MRRLCLVHWDIAEAEKKAPGLKDLGYEVECAAPRGYPGLRPLRDSPPDVPAVPPSPMEGYSGTPLPRKLGLKPASTVALLGAPDGFEATLGELPDGLVFTRGAGGPCDVVLWFVRSRAELEGEVGRIGAGLGGGRLWIIWPKKASGVVTDVTQQLVREVGLGAGMVDYKVCSVDATWSGLLFARRKA